MEAAFSEAWKVLSDPKGAALERRAPTPLAPPFRPPPPRSSPTPDRTRVRWSLAPRRKLQVARDVAEAACLVAHRAPDGSAAGAPPPGSAAPRPDGEGRGAPAGPSGRMQPRVRAHCSTKLAEWCSQAAARAQSHSSPPDGPAAPTKRARQGDRRAAPGPGPGPPPFALAAAAWDLLADLLPGVPEPSARALLPRALSAAGAGVALAAAAAAPGGGLPEGPAALLRACGRVLRAASAHPAPYDESLGAALPALRLAAGPEGPAGPAGDACRGALACALRGLEGPVNRRRVADLLWEDPAALAALAWAAAVPGDGDGGGGDVWGAGRVLERALFDGPALAALVGACAAGVSRAAGARGPRRRGGGGELTPGKG